VNGGCTEELSKGWGGFTEVQQAITEDFLPALFRDTLDENDIRRLCNFQ
jgi:hypothetical protein